MGKLIYTSTFLISTALCSALYSSANDNYINIKDKAVVFFTISQLEYDKFSDQEKNELDEVLSDFYHYHQKIASFLKNNEIKSILTDKSIIHIHFGNNQKTTYKRNKLKHVVGLIMTDKINKPKVFLGVATDVGLKSMFKEYFKIK